ncbi:IclR family transcriptional regulator [Cohnella abietis]|uniref:Glycerol operon regulatory protein n=1 Tax=Cohnella abietis TaxID=2507935 RepID=A0A3T1CZE6_9BACL|nr:IclR family transcriptional regulator [Cohnella abietis]BBI31204.1 IclR family transcriptional regulator [Cohnella abietis]
MENTGKQVTFVKSADRVLDILELLADQQHSLNLVEISRRLDLPTSSTYKIIQNLLERGYLESDNSEKQFRLGHKLLEIATKYTQNTDLISEFQHIALKIVGDINEAVFLSIRDRDKILYVSEKQSSHPVRFVSHMGMKLPIHSTAMGKAMLSKNTDEEISSIYSDKSLGKLTESTINDLDQLLEQIREARDDGLFHSYGEAVQGVRCVAAPICNSNNEAVAAIGISIPETRLTDELWQRAQDWVKQSAKELSLRIYYHGIAQGNDN